MENVKFSVLATLSQPTEMNYSIY